MLYFLHRFRDILNEKGSKPAIILLSTGILLSLLHRSPSFSIKTSRVFNPQNAPLGSLFYRIDQCNSTSSYGTMPTSHFHGRQKEIDTSSTSLSRIKNMTTEQLAQLVLSNCRLTNHVQGLTSESIYRLAINAVGGARLSKWYKDAHVLSPNGKILAYCLNTKSASTYLRQYVLVKGEKQLLMKTRNENLITAFIVIREPMHRLLSAYLNKFKNCKHYLRTCELWKSFAQNVAQFVKHVNKTHSNLFGAELRYVESSDVTFNDFIDYIIHMYLSNDGKITRPLPIIPTSSWTWGHWESVVQDSCFPCGAVWQDVVLFENLAEHLQQVLPKYPELFKHPEKISRLIPGKTEAKLMEHFQEISDSQLWFLGNVMYALDYAVLPYDFKAFCKSLNRSVDSTNLR